MKLIKNKVRFLVVAGLVALISACGDGGLNNINIVKSGDAPTTAESNTTDNIKSSIAPEKRSISFKAAVIKGSGDITPVARTEFTFRKYDVHSLISSYTINNKLPAKPSSIDSKYSSYCGTYVNNNTVCVIDFPAFTIDLTTWYKDNFSNFKNEQKKASNNVGPISIKTDLSGEATVNLDDGQWYITGNYSNSLSLVSWQSSPITISKDTKKIEMSNDTGKIVDLNVPYTRGTSYYDRKSYNDGNTKIFEALPFTAFEDSLKND